MIDINFKDVVVYSLNVFNDYENIKQKTKDILYYEIKEEIFSLNNIEHQKLEIFIQGICISFSDYCKTENDISTQSTIDRIRYQLVFNSIMKNGIKSSLLYQQGIIQNGL